jgi:hypothetical protein
MEGTGNGTITFGLRTGNGNMADLDQGQIRNTTDKAKMTRDQFLHYFNNEGSVPWQNNFL